MGMRESTMHSVNKTTVDDLLVAAQYCDAQESDNSGKELLVRLSTYVPRSCCDAVERQVNEAEEAVHNHI